MVANKKKLLHYHEHKIIFFIIIIHIQLEEIEKRIFAIS